MSNLKDELKKQAEHYTGYTIHVYPKGSIHVTVGKYGALNELFNTLDTDLFTIPLGTDDEYGRESVAANLRRKYPDHNSAEPIDNVILDENLPDIKWRIVDGDTTYIVKESENEQERKIDISEGALLKFESPDQIWGVIEDEVIYAIYRIKTEDEAGNVHYKLVFRERFTGERPSFLLHMESDGHVHIVSGDHMDRFLRQCCPGSPPPPEI